MTEVLKRIFLDEQMADERVRLMDPLRLDGFLITDLPGINRLKANTSLQRAIRQFTPQLDTLQDINLLTARAVTRDIGFMAVSYVTNGGSLADIPSAIKTLRDMAQITHEVPRDTVYSYGLRNPLGERMRTFTTAEEERLFIASFSKAMIKLPDSVVALQQARESFQDPDIVAKRLEAARINFQGMATSILEVRRHVPPEVFSYQLRPYFPPLTIDGKTYYGPGGAQMPVLLIDNILWASMGNSQLQPEYAPYYEDNAQYLPKSLRDASAQLTEQRSLLDLFLEVAGNADYRQVGVKLAQFATQIGKFRHPHLGVAKANMQIRPENSVGSGGYDVGVLEMLIKNLNSARGKVLNP